MTSASDIDTCLLARFPGTQPPDWLLRWLGDGLGGVLLFAGNITGEPQLAELVGRLRACNPDVLVAVDEEGGVVTRVEAATGSSYPGNAALGAVDDLDLTRAIAASIGATLASCGINLDLAPVADTDSNPENPVIGVRSFGADPNLVAAHTSAFIAGLQANRVAACAKHWPGHGRASADSHLELPVVTATLEQLSEVELVPFAAAIQAGVRAVMTAHVVFPAVDDQPATTSRRWLAGMLREEFGFDGVIITDALGMAAIGDSEHSAAGAVRSLAAGADMLCLPESSAAQQQSRAAVRDAVASGDISRTRLSRAAERVRELAAWARPEPAGAASPALGAVAARRALLIEGDIQPLSAAPYVLDAGGRMSRQLADSAASLLGLIRDRIPGADGVRLAAPAPGDGTADLPGLLAAAAGRPLVVAVSDAHRRPWQRDLLAGVLAVRPDAIVVGTGGTQDRALAGGAYLGTRGAGRANLTVAADLLAGRASSQGGRA
jgi:beta-N-acetylhexosaminidase